MLSEVLDEILSGVLFYVCSNKCSGSENYLLTLSTLPVYLILKHRTVGCRRALEPKILSLGLVRFTSF